MATTHDWRTGTYGIDPQGRGNFNGQQEGLEGVEYAMIRYIDTTATALVSGDTYKLMTVDAGVLVTSVQTLVTTVEGETGTLQVGDDDEDEFDADVNMQTAALATAGDASSKYYATANYIGITPNHALEDCKFYVIVKCIRLI